MTELITSRTLKFEPNAGKKSILAWSKYSTLIEITSLSTSPNQLRDAMPDIKRLLDVSSPIPISWTVVLISLGFSSGSSGVQKAVWEMILDLDEQRLARLFGEVEGRRFLKGIHTAVLGLSLKILTRKQRLSCRMVRLLVVFQ